MSEDRRPTEQEIEQLKAEHGDELHLLTAGRFAVVVTPPPRHKYKRFKSAVLDPKKRDAALETLFLDCVVWPERASIDQLLERYPGMAETFGDKLLELAGVVDDAHLAKL